MRLRRHFLRMAYGCTIGLLIVVIFTVKIPAGAKNCVYIHDTEVYVPSDVVLANRQVNIVFLIDNQVYQNLVNLISSIYANTRSPVNMYIGHCNTDAATIRSFLSCFSIPNFDPSQVTFAEFDPTWEDEVKFNSYSKLQKGGSNRLASCGNYMRFFLPRMFADIEKIIYLDTDMIVQGDVAELDYYTENMETTIAVTKRRNIDFKLSDAFPDEVKGEYEQFHQVQSLDMSQTSFCAGIFVANLERWRANFQDILLNVNFWIDVAVDHSKRQGMQRWWERPTQSLMQLVFNGDFTWIPDRNWHSEGLGYISNLCEEHLIVAKLLHWNGPKKPWSSTRYDKYWKAFTPLQCQGRGSCTLRSETGGAFYACSCHQGFVGNLCQLADNKNYNPFV